MRLHLFSKDDLSQYQAFSDAHEHATPYHNVAWGMAVEQAYGFDMRYFGVYQDKTLIAVMPSILMKSIRGKKILCALPYCDLGGVLSDNENTEANLLDKVVKYCKQHGYGFEYRASENSEANTKDEGSSQEYEDGTKVRMLFKLLDDVDAQLASFKPKLRSQIKKAAKNGVTSTVISRPNTQDISEFYSVFAVNMRSLGSPVHSKQWFSSIFNNYKDNAFLVLVYFDEICVGGGIVLHTNNQAVIPWASTLREYNKKAPNMLLYWEVLSEVIRRKILDFDFGRSSMNEGTYRFKKQWGALPTKLCWQSLAGEQLQDEITSKKSNTREQVEKLWQKLPLGLTTSIGPKIRKHISL